MISVKTEKEIALMREAGSRLAKIMRELEKNIYAGMNTLKLDKLAERLVFSMGGYSAFKGYKGVSSSPFPATICASLNDEVVHGIPSEKIILKEGDVFKIDIGMKYRGVFSDMARSFIVGRADFEAKRIVKAVEESFKRGIREIKEGKKISDYSRAVQRYVEKNGFSVVRNLVGHGIGKKLHEDPQIPNYYDKNNPDFELKSGMTFALEPMINAGGWETVSGKDGWVFKTADGSLSAHWENTILITKKGVEILTI